MYLLSIVIEFKTIIASSSSKSLSVLTQVNVLRVASSRPIPFINPGRLAPALLVNTSMIRFLYSILGSSNNLGHDTNAPSSSKKFHT